jgi:hypothetical protein
MKRSASVDLPWSICAMIEKLRTFCMKREGHRTGALGRPHWLGSRGAAAAEYVELTRILAEIPAPRDHRLALGTS